MTYIILVEDAAVVRGVDGVRGVALLTPMWSELPNTALTTSIRGGCSPTQHPAVMCWEIFPFLNIIMC